MSLEELERSVNGALKLRAEYVKTMDRVLGKPIEARPMKDDEFVQWFEQKMAESPVVTIVAMGPPATDWMEPGTRITGPAWFLAIALPSTEDAAQEIGRYKRLTGKKNPLDEVMRHASR